MESAQTSAGSRAGKSQRELLRIPGVEKFDPKDTYVKALLAIDDQETPELNFRNTSD